MIWGFESGDVVRAEVPKKKHVGTRVAVRATGCFRAGKADGINWKHCR
jgi:hypothetical protein